MTAGRGKRLRIEHPKPSIESEIHRPKSTLAVLLLGLCLCILAIRVTYTEFPMAQSSTSPMNLGDMIYSLTLSGLLLAAVVAWFLKSVFSERPAYHVTGMEIGLVLFLAAGVVSTCTAADKRLAISEMALLFAPILAAILIVQILRTIGRVGIVLTVVAALGVVSTYQSFEQLTTSNRMLEEQYRQNPQSVLEPLGIEAGTLDHFMFEHRLHSRVIRGYFTTSNSAASFGLLACFAAFALIAERSASQARRNLLLPGIAVVILTAGLFLTQSKGGIASFLLAIVLLGVFHLWRRQTPGRQRTLLIAATLLGVVVLAVVVYGTISYGMRHDRLPGGNSMLVRWQYWKASARMIADHPLTGVGPGNFASYYSHYKPAEAIESVADPHSLPLSLLAQYGPLGLIGFLAMVLIPLGRSLWTLPQGTSGTILCWSGSKRAILLTLGGLSLCLLVIRAILIPIPPGDSAEIFIYDLVSLYVAPVAAFLIGFLVLVLPLNAERTDTTPLWTSGVVVTMVCGIVGVLVHNMIDFALFEPGVWMTFWFALACLIALSHEKGVRPLFSTSTGWRALAVIVATMILGGYATVVWAPVFQTTVNIASARAEMSVGGIDTAHRLLDAAIQTDPFSSAALNLKGNLYLQQYDGQPSKEPALLRDAAECFRKATEVNPAEYKNYEKAGLAFSLLGQDEQAYEWYGKAAGLYPENERIQMRLAQTADRMGKRDAALAYYRKAVEIENAFRSQFTQMYPKWEKQVSRLGESDYQLALKRIKELSGT
jgi:O-antigen ligase